jgi:hypothetical protein
MSLFLPALAIRFFVQNSAGDVRTITFGTVPTDSDLVELTPSRRFSTSTHERIYDLESSHTRRSDDQTH